MATHKSQRIFIWVIAIVMIIGTVAGFVAMILAPKNDQADQDRLKVLNEQYMKDYQEHSAKVAAITQRFEDDKQKNSDKYFGTFSAYEKRVGKFNAADVTELKKDDVKAGDGDEIGASDSAAVYYIGWNPNGKVFDGSIESSALKGAFVMQPGTVIEGWTQGVQGMKVGGVRELTIPADLAYGAQGQGEDIPADTPLKFIVMVIEKVDIPAAPEMPKELQRAYSGM